VRSLIFEIFVQLLRKRNHDWLENIAPTLSSDDKEVKRLPSCLIFEIFVQLLRKRNHDWLENIAPTLSSDDKEVKRLPS
jgi:hypothetical protein